jgi:hypothetical protein
VARKLIYTVITGGYDTPSPCPNFQGWDFLLITDNSNINANGWPLKVVPESDNPCKLQRYWKINSHLLGYALTVYIDGNMTLRADPQAIADKYFKGSLALVQHPSRHSMIDEGEAVIMAKKDTFGNVRKQVGHYISEGIPYRFGMWASGMLIRDNSLKDFETTWWKEVEKFSHRDQLSLPYAIWKTNQDFGVIPWQTLTRYVTIQKHLPKKEMSIYYSNPYSTSKNFGGAINRFCELVPNYEDWIVIQDGDICYLRPDWGVIVEKSLALHGHKFGLIGCYTNSIGAFHQTLEGKRVTDKPMDYHYTKALELNTYEIEDLGSLGVAGFFMAFQTKTWKKVGGFKENYRAFDTWFNNQVRAQGMKIGIMKGLYVYHLYRIWAKGNPQKEVNHL